MAILNIRCADKPGLVAATSACIDAAGGNIIDADQHTDRTHSLFLQRIDFSMPSASQLDAFALSFSELAQSLDMTWTLHGDERPRVVLMVSKEGHCLYDLLTRHALGELEIDIPMVISNHEDHRGATESFGVPFTYLPVDPEAKEVQQTELLSILTDLDPDLIVMARYMQILPAAIVEAFQQRIINIHHSFLPAFAGARPYHRAFERGVKIIGATAHYATAELDEGPIISQQVTPVSHRDDVDDLIRRGRELEKVVLADAVRKHVEYRIQVYDNRTVVFG